MTLALIANHAIQTADGNICRLLSDFMEENAQQTPVCRVERTTGVHQYGVVRLTPDDLDIQHTFSLTTNQNVFMMANRDFTHSVIYAPTRNDESLMEMVLVAVYSRLAYYKTAFVHASLVDTQGEGGVMFVGRSGIGKTTQARLWESFRGAEIINGDKVFLTLDGQTVTAHGNPWHGSSPYCLNKKVPLKGIVVLDQAPTNTIRRLSTIEALSQYVPHIFLPQWDKELTDMVMQTIGEMLPLVPVFRLACRPDEEAVQMTHDAIFG